MCNRSISLEPRARRAGHTGEGRKAGVAKRRKEEPERRKNRGQAREQRAQQELREREEAQPLVSQVPGSSLGPLPWCYYRDNNRDYDLAKRCREDEVRHVHQAPSPALCSQ